jgi:hypothetical protein
MTLPAPAAAGGMKMSMKFRTLTALTLLAATPLEAGERLAMRLSRTRAFEPATVVVTATVERDAQNRAMEIEAESSDFYRSSLVPLEGENAPRTTTVEFRGLPGGKYEVRLILLGSDGQARASAARDLDIISTR